MRPRTRERRGDSYFSSALLVNEPTIPDLSQVKAEIGDTDHQQHGQVDRSKNQAEDPEVFPANVTTAVIDRARAGGLRGDGPHQAQGVAEKQRDQLHRHFGNRDGCSQENRKQGRRRRHEAGEHIVHDEVNHGQHNDNGYHWVAAHCSGGAAREPFEEPDLVQPRPDRLI